MRRLTAILCLTLAVLLGITGVSESADFQKGADAWKKRDHATALREWKPLAEQGHAGAQVGLGVMYESRKGIPQNDKTAEKWWRLAAEQGLAYAQTNLDFMYEIGKGVPQDDKTAL
jgi:TPR repeat protein